MPTSTAEPVRHSLLVMSKVGVFTVPLPRSGEILVGRGSDCQVRLDDPKVSRHHATIRLGSHVELCDLGSANGTFISGRRVDPGATDPLAAGAVVTIGSHVLVLQAAAEGAPVRVWSEAAFEERVAAERARPRAAAPSGGPGYGVARVRVASGTALECESLTRTERFAEISRAESFERALREALRQDDVIASIKPGEYAILLPQTDLATAESMSAALLGALRRAGFDVEVTLDCARPEAAAPVTPPQSRMTLPAPGTPGGAIDPATIERIAQSAINVLILGETGVGKEVMAKRLHGGSRRAGQPLLCLNCAAFTETLLESELFGYERGAFTGAMQPKPGLLEAAHGGTVFLDEVGEMSSSIQAKLLRVLDQREVQRIGALKPRLIDVRFLSATNRNLEREVEAGRFRRDLFFRLNGVSLTIPPLRDRVDEILPLARAFLTDAFAEAGHAAVPDILPAALALLERYTWPGNVRELRNAMERAAVLWIEGPIGLEQLPAEKMATAKPLGDTSQLEAFYETAPEEERERILAALTSCKGNQTEAAKVLGISRRTLVKKLGRYELPRPRKGR